MIQRISKTKLFLAICIILVNHFDCWAQLKKDTAPEMSSEIYEKLKPVTVNIIRNNGTGNGSGSIIGITKTGQALVLTACHVIAVRDEDPDVALEFYKDIQIKTVADLRPIRAIVLEGFVNRDNDLALIFTADPVLVDRVISYSISNDAVPGRQMAALGYPDFPKSDKPSQRAGKITRQESNYLVFDAHIAPGNSGGPVIDKHGRMIGVSTSIRNEENEGYAIMMDLVVPIVEKWLKDERIQKNYKLDKKWKRQKYTTFWERLYKDPMFIVPEAIILIGVLYEIFKPREEMFPQPPGRPTGN